MQKIMEVEENTGWERLTVFGHRMGIEAGGWQVTKKLVVSKYPVTRHELLYSKDGERDGEFTKPNSNKHPLWRLSTKWPNSWLNRTQPLCKIGVFNTNYKIVILRPSQHENYHQVGSHGNWLVCQSINFDKNSIFFPLQSRKASQINQASKINK